MTGIELLISLFVGILSSSISVLADRYDSKDSAQFEELKKQLAKSNVFEKTIAKSLKSIKVNSKEIDELKVLINDDIFTNKLANIIIKPSQENEIIKLLVSRIKEGCNLSENQALTLDPFIKEFAFTLYGKVLNSDLALHLVIKEIEASSKLSQKEHAQIKGGIKNLAADLKKIQLVVNKIDSTQSVQEKGYDLAMLPGTSTNIRIADSSRTTNLIAGELNVALEKLNIYFKSEVDEIREIQKKRDFTKAIELYKSLLEKADHQIDNIAIYGIYIDCALCSINIDDIISADDWLSKAEKLDINDERVFAVRGLYYFQQKDANANTYIDKAIAINGFYHLAVMLKSAIEIEGGSTGNSLLDKYFLDEAGNIKEGFKEKHLSVIHRTVGQCYLKDNEYDNAEKHFVKSLDLDSLDDSTQALIGTTYMLKALRKDDEPIQFYQKLSTENENLIQLAINHFSKALELSGHLNRVKYHVATYTNLTTCYMILGDYDKAYDVSGISTTAEDILKSRAAAAYHKGFYGEAEELLSKISNTSALDISNRIVTLLKADDKDKALALIDETIEKGTFSESDLSEIRYLKYEIHLSNKDKENIQKELSEIKRSVLPTWQKEKALGDYYKFTDEHENADTHYRNAIADSNIASPTKIFIADYYFTKEDFPTCYEICSSIPLEELQSDHDISKRLLQMSVISSFNVGDFNGCRKFIQHGIKQGFNDAYLYEFSTTMYWQSDELEKAEEELSTQLSKEDNENDVYLLGNLGLISSMLGKFNDAQDYFNRAEAMDTFYNNSDIVINSIITFTVVNNSIKAKAILNKALELKFSDKHDRIHKFIPIYYLRENNAQLFAEYAVEFNSRHGDTEWLWKKNVEKDKEELRSIFINSIRTSNEAKKNYLTQPIPLVCLSSWLGKKEIIHWWNFNREYGIPIYLESGSPDELLFETSKLSNCKSILVDYTALLTLNNMGTEYLWALDNAFDEILIYRPIFLMILNELMVEEHNDLREIINYISSSEKVRFIKRELKIERNYQGTPISNIISDEYCGLFQVSRKQNVTLLVGELRLRGLAININLTACGIRAFLEHSKKTRKIDADTINKGVIELIKKDMEFISFNSSTLDYIFNNYSLEEAKDIFKKFGKHIFLANSEIDTFTSTYLHFINKNIESINDKEVIKSFIQSTVNDVKHLTSRALCYNSVPELKVDGKLSDMIKINRLCLGFIFLLLVAVYKSNISEELTTEYIKTIEKETNLAYWYETKYKKQSIIKYVFNEAKKEAATKNRKKAPKSTENRKPKKKA